MPNRHCMIVRTNVQERIPTEILRRFRSRRRIWGAKYMSHCMVTLQILRGVPGNTSVDGASMWKLDASSEAENNSTLVPVNDTSRKVMCRKLIRGREATGLRKCFTAPDEGRFAQKKVLLASQHWRSQDSTSRPCAHAKQSHIQACSGGCVGGAFPCAWSQHCCQESTDLYGWNAEKNASPQLPPAHTLSPTEPKSDIRPTPM